MLTLRRVKVQCKLFSLNFFSIIRTDMSDRYIPIQTGIFRLLPIPSSGSRVSLSGVKNVLQFFAAVIVVVSATRGRLCS